MCNIAYVRQTLFIYIMKDYKFINNMLENIISEQWNGCTSFKFFKFHYIVL
jgi:hypothetical protein